MRHIGYLVKAVLLVTLLFIAVNQAVFPLLKAEIIDSKFRVVIAGKASSYLNPYQRLTLNGSRFKRPRTVDPVQGRSSQRL